GLELAYRDARDTLSRWPSAALEAEGEPRVVRVLLREPSEAPSVARRQAALSLLEGAAEEPLRRLEIGLDQAAQAVLDLLTAVPVERHPDAGPEGGSAQLAERWLDDSEALTREGVAFALRRAGAPHGD